MSCSVIYPVHMPVLYIICEENNGGTRQASDTVSNLLALITWEYMYMCIYIACVQAPSLVCAFAISCWMDYRGPTYMCMYTCSLCTALSLQFMCIIEYTCTLYVPNVTCDIGVWWSHGNHVHSTLDD